MMKLWAQEVIKRIEQQATMTSSRPDTDNDLPIQIDSEKSRSISSG
jgi:hypothetical protein